MLCDNDLAKYEIIGWLPLHISLKAAAMKQSGEKEESVLG